jgi:hypothetical protein
MRDAVLPYPTFPILLSSPKPLLFRSLPSAFGANSLPLSAHGGVLM